MLAKEFEKLNISEKKQKGVFLTTQAELITEGMEVPRDIKIIEPCVGNGDLLRLVHGNPIETYDIRDVSDKKHPNFTVKDILEDPPSYKDSWVLANPPYLARNKARDKKIFDNYGENDLYKCFILAIAVTKHPGTRGLVPNLLRALVFVEWNTTFLGKQFPFGRLFGRRRREHTRKLCDTVGGKRNKRACVARFGGKLPECRNELSASVSRLFE